RAALCDWADPVVLDQRAPELGHRIERSIGPRPPEARLDPAGRAAHCSPGAQVAGLARSFVEDGAQPFVHRLHSRELVLAGGEQRPRRPNPGSPGTPSPPAWSHVTPSHGGAQPEAAVYGVFSAPPASGQTAG